MLKQKADHKRHNKILQVMVEEGKICFTCIYFEEFRDYGDILEHGEFKGRCYYPDEAEFADLPAPGEEIIVEQDSTCNRHSLIGAWREN